MNQDYFVHNGTRYNSGSLISFRVYDYRAKGSYITNVTFLYYDTDTQKYHIDVYGKEDSYDAELFFKNLQPTKNSTIFNGTKKYKHTFSDELNIDALLIGWIWYVFIMAVGTIFYARIGIWIFSSIIFFNFRNKMLKEAGYK